MKILVTGAKGFVGRNLCCRLKNLRDGKAPAVEGVEVSEVMEADVETSADLLRDYCRRADFVFNLAGVNRPQNEAEFMEGNCDFLAGLLAELRRRETCPPVMLSSSIQASLEGGYALSGYGRSKQAAEDLLFNYGSETGADVMVYRFPNLFGKWGRPNYNSVVATFCHNISRDLPIRVNDPATELELVYIDDLVDEMVEALAGRPHRDGRYCRVAVTHRTTLGEIERLLRSFRRIPQTLEIPTMEKGSFASKLCSTYLSAMPPQCAAVELTPHIDARGSFTEAIRCAGAGQISINVSAPGVTKGEHWHDSKWEQFIVVAGHGLIRLRQVGSAEVTEFEVSGDRPVMVTMLPGYTHSLVNLSDSEPMTTIIWVNETFDPQRPDTFRDPVGNKG